MIFYILPSIIFIISFSDYMKNYKLKKAIFMLILFILVIFCTFKSVSTESFYGYDTNQYIKFYNNFYYRFDSSLEVGYRLLNLIIHMFSSDYKYLFLVMSLLTIFFIGKYIDYNTDNKFIALLAYVCIFYYIRDLSQIRAALGYAMAIYSVKYLMEGKTKVFFMYTILATSIHSSSIFMILVYPLRKLKLKKSHLYIILLISMLLTNVDWMKSSLDLFSKFADNDYVRSFMIYTNYYDSRGLDSKFLLYILISFIGIYIKDNPNIKSEIYEINIYILVFGIFIAGLFNGSEVISIRLSELYITSMIIIISKFKNIVNDRYLEVIMHISICLFLIVYNIAFINSLSQYGIMY
ncbi:MAG: EpsG family protein [Romboutsia sp.]